jgi:hypothetical protein
MRWPHLPDCPPRPRGRKRGAREARTGSFATRTDTPKSTERLDGRCAAAQEQPPCASAAPRLTSPRRSCQAPPPRVSPASIRRRSRGGCFGVDSVVREGYFAMGCGRRAGSADMATGAARIRTVYTHDELISLDVFCPTKRAALPGGCRGRPPGAPRAAGRALGPNRPRRASRFGCARPRSNQELEMANGKRPL